MRLAGLTDHVHTSFLASNLGVSALVVLRHTSKERERRAYLVLRGHITTTGWTSVLSSRLL